MSPRYKHDTSKGPRHTARGIVIKDGTVLLMERWRDGLHYFSIPGGGIEPGETPEQTAIREIAEETTVTVSIERLLYTMNDAVGHTHLIFLCNWLAGEPTMPPDAPEMLLHDPNDRYEPKWVSFTEVDSLSYEYWRPIFIELAKDLPAGFKNEPKVLAAQ